MTPVEPPRRPTDGPPSWRTPAVAVVALVCVLLVVTGLVALRADRFDTGAGGVRSGSTTSATSEAVAPAVDPAVAPATTAEVATTTAAPTTAAAAPRTPTTPTTPTTATTGGDPVLLAAGDIASCSWSGDEATAALLNARPGATVATLGDNAYDRGTPAEFDRCYAPTWGAVKARTKPATGNHDYATAGAAGYFGYFGASVGDAAAGYYSYDLGAWHVVALNSNCSIVSCAAGGAQERWLRADLAAHPAACTLAYWHHPRFSSGTVHGSSTAVAPLWQALYDGNADLVLSGHEHSYERFAPLDPAGTPDPGRGLRSFVVGTGGSPTYPLGTPLAGSEARRTGTSGVLQLTLRAGGYGWQFLPVAGQTFSDSGSGRCH